MGKKIIWEEGIFVKGKCIRLRKVQRIGIIKNRRIRKIYLEAILVF